MSRSKWRPDLVEIWVGPNGEQQRKHWLRDGVLACGAPIERASQIRSQVRVPRGRFPPFACASCYDEVWRTTDRVRYADLKEPSKDMELVSALLDSLEAKIDH